MTMEKETIMEREMTTRDKIVLVALRLFSQKGYEGVSMREIAAAVGMKGASLYNHFKGKEAIFQEIFAEMNRHYAQLAHRLQIPSDEGEEAVQAYLDMGEPVLLQMGEAVYSFFAKDEFAVLFRRLLVSEQNRYPLAAQYMREYYIDSPFQFEQKVFAGMLCRKGFRQADAEVMALQFYSPIFYLLSKYDLEGNYEECIEQLRKHIHWFFILYKDKEIQNA